MVDRLFALLLYLLPHHLLSQGMHWLTRCRWEPLKDQMIRGAIRLYKVDMSQAAEPDPTRYSSFNDFFTRRLRDDARPAAVEEEAILCPVDGAVSQAGKIVDGRIFQAKGHNFSLYELLGGDEEWTEKFAEGSYTTLYLSPRDYHRIHMPLSGMLKKMLHVPGRLFSVSPSTTRTVPRLFSRNERLVNLFDTEIGPMAVIMVGAIFVSSMDTVWAGTVTPLSQRVTRWNYTNAPIEPAFLEKGEEMGRFNMGSTVILLFGREAIEWQEQLKPGTEVCMGEKIAERQSETDGETEGA
ncbi:MAG: archaetidylserine decarboxylase [Candidatus Sedimenticola sp. (ex Thyasira tokunagai)]